MKKIILFIVTLIFIHVLSSCSSGYKIEKGMRFGPELPSLCVGLQTNKTEYQMENFELDLYYGWAKDYFLAPMNGYESVAAVIFITEGTKVLEPKEYDDFNDLGDDFYIIKVITEDLNNQKYFVEFDRFGKASYGYQEKVIIPKDVLSNPKVGFTINIVCFERNIETGKYIFSSGSNMKFEFEILENGNINLDPKSSSSNKAETITV